MRRIGLAALLVLVLAIAVASEEVKGSKAIGEYPIGEFAIKGRIEHQLNQWVKEIKAKLEKKGEQLQITVIGSADTTGSSVSNDKLAKDRAEQVTAVLSANFPDAKVVAWSKGDAENVRQVRVEYKIIFTPPTPTPVAPAEKQPVEKPTIKTEIFIVISILLAAGIFSLILVLFPGTSRQRKVKKVTNGIRWMDLVVDGEKYSVEVEFKDGKFVSPFKNASGNYIVRASRSELKSSFRGCLKKDEFAEQTRELLRNGKIKLPDPGNR